jgi:hypothetical protein
MFGAFDAKRELFARSHFRSFPWWSACGFRPTSTSELVTSWTGPSYLTHNVAHFSCWEIIGQCPRETVPTRRRADHAHACSNMIHMRDHIWLVPLDLIRFVSDISFSAAPRLIVYQEERNAVLFVSRWGRRFWR